MRLLVEEANKAMPVSIFVDGEMKVVGLDNGCVLLVSCTAATNWISGNKKTKRRDDAVWRNEILELY